MLPYFTEAYGNPGSVTHAFGEQARAAVAEARGQIAGHIGASSREIVFTSGATESNNLAIKGVAARWKHRGSHLVGLATEHPSVLEPLRKLGRRGFEVTLAPVDEVGVLDVGRLESLLRPDTVLVSVQAANHEIGTIQPLAEIGRLCRERGILFHCDASQAVGKIPIDVNAAGVDLMSFTAHKIHGPKGIGALYVRRDDAVKLESQIDGGGQQGGLRGGTLPTPLIVGFAQAMHLGLKNPKEEQVQLSTLRNRLWERIRGEIPDLVLNGPALSPDPLLRLPGNLNVGFPNIDEQALLLSLPDVAVSSGSACASDIAEPSSVLAALGRDLENPQANLRFGLGRFTTEAEIDFAIDRVTKTARKLRDPAKS
ncbi:MAG: aminotransferase class V-fold PLP-dependent enzyme, partial [Planctomycetales bacterium]